MRFYVNKKHNNKTSHEKCIICQDDVDMDISNAQPMPCDHHDNTYHNCVLMWSLYNSHCPICQELLPESCVYNIDRNFDTDTNIKMEKNYNSIDTEISKKMKLRLTNDNKIKLYQDRQGEGMKKRYKHNVKLDLGTVVNLKVDKRDRNSTKIRIVVKTIESETSFLCGIATRHGVISSRENMIMYDPASLVKLSKPTITRELANLQRKIINSKICIDTLPTITVAKAHKLKYSKETK